MVTSGVKLMCLCSFHITVGILLNIELVNLVAVRLYIDCIIEIYTFRVITFFGQIEDIVPMSTINPFALTRCRLLYTSVSVFESR